MPTLPNAATTLSGDATGITNVNLIKRILRRLSHNDPWTDKITDAGGINSSVTTITVADTTPYQKGMWLDFLNDGTLERMLIEAVASSTALTVRRGYMGTTAAAHLLNAEFRLMDRYCPFIIDETITDLAPSLWPDLFEVRHVDWTISTSSTPEIWYGLPADAERVVEVYQRTNSTPLDLRTPGSSADAPRWLETGFLGGAVPKGLQVYGVAINSNDNRLHATYLSRLSLSTLTTEQIAILTYMVGSEVLGTALAGESKPDRRANMGTVPEAREAMLLFDRRAEVLKRKEQERLMGYLPRRNHMAYRGSRHFAEGGHIAWHPVRPF